MPRALRLVVAALVLVPVPAVGCGPSKSDGQPNPDLKVPDIPPSGHGTKSLGKDKKGAK